METTEQSLHNLQLYYRFHSLIYDATRWAFLFGRQGIITRFLPDHWLPEHILEVGCGTGHNLAQLAHRYPEAQLTGIDLSDDMLRKARRKPELANPGVTLINRAYHSGLFEEQQFDLILFSYSLSMMNPGWEDVLTTARGHLSQNGLVAVVDFFNSPFPFFRRWMQFNHVRMEGHLSPVLLREYQTVGMKVHKAYGGLWEYLSYIGRRQ